MNQSNFNEHVEECFERSRKVLVQKRAEYSKDKDVFHNFNNAIGISLHDTNVAVAWEYCVKHLQSIKDIIEAVETTALNLTVSKDVLSEKFGDAINYFLLIEGMLKEIIDNQKNVNEQI